MTAAYYGRPPRTGFLPCGHGWYSAAHFSWGRSGCFACARELSEQRQSKEPAVPTTTLDLTGADAMQLGHSANMVAALPDHLAGDLPKHVRHASLDAFGVHASLLAQFLVESGVDDARLSDLIQMVADHVTTYGPVRADEPLVSIDTAEVRSWLLPLVAEQVAGIDPIDGYVTAAIAGDYPE